MNNIEKLKQAIIEGKLSEAEELTRTILAEEINFAELLPQLSEAMNIVGQKFETFEVFLPEMISAADCMMAVMDLITPKLQEQGLDHNKGKVVMGAPAGDMHEIGKDIVKTVLSGNGYEIVDLGPDTNSLEFIKTAQKEEADVIAISTLMTTTMPGAAEVVRLLKDQGLRENFKVIVGGAPTNESWAEEIGADGWAPDAFSATKLVDKLLQ